jgi:regulator of sirC expression with transglutaminase-like and TPR domain
MASTAPHPRRLFAAEVARPEAEMSMARSALLVAQEEYPQIPVELYLARLDQMAEEAKDRLADETAPMVVLEELLDMLFERRRFTGNKQAYYDPRNSFLNDVLDRGTGIPLTLGMILLEVGWRLGLPLEGVSFPSHFLVRYRGDALNLLIDPFDGGKVRFEDQAQELLDQLYGGVIRVQDSFLKTATKREMLVRLLTNLKGVYVNVSDHPRALAVVERLLILHPTPPRHPRALAAVERLLILQPTSRGDLRARGLLLTRLGRRTEAAEQLRAYLDLAPGAGDAEKIRALVEDLRAGRPMEREEGEEL